MPDLGIFIVTVKRRQTYLARLMRHFEPQLSERIALRVMEVPPLDEGGPVIGTSRQLMIEDHADCKWCCFFDDDDLPAPDYCPRILDALDQDPDVVGFRVRYYRDSLHRGNAIHSVTIDGWRTERGIPGTLDTYYRTPNHLNPLRREIALAVGYKPMVSGEDSDFSHRLKSRFPSMREVFIDRFLYHYFHRSDRVNEAENIVEEPAHAL
jgi:hypothetical protein